jgi:hypothetical protein
MKAKFALLIKGGTITQERAYELASRAVGRALVPGFGLSTCDHGELIRVLDAVTGKAQSAERRAPDPSGLESPPSGSETPPGRRPGRKPERHALTAMRHAPNVVRIATVGQLQRASSLERELKIGMDEAAGIARRATGVAHPRTAGQVGRYTEALKAIRRRRLNRPPGHSPIRGGSQDAMSAKV